MNLEDNERVSVVVKRKDAAQLAIMIMRDLLTQGRHLEQQRKDRYKKDRAEVYANGSGKPEFKEMSRRKFAMHAEQWPERLELARMYFRLLSLDLVSDLGLQGDKAQHVHSFEEKLSTFTETLTQYVNDIRLFHEELAVFTEERVTALWMNVLEQAGLDAVKRATGGRKGATRPAGGKPGRGKQHEVRLRHASEIVPDVGGDEQEDSDAGK